MKYQKTILQRLGRRRYEWIYFNTLENEENEEEEENIKLRH